MSHHDVVIVGAGLSGIGAAVHLQRACPGKSFALIESRDALGGTWDLYRYPGIPLGQRHAHPRLRLQTVARQEIDRRRPVHPRLRRRDRRRERRTTPHPLQPQARQRLVVERGRALDARTRSHRRRPHARADDLQLPADVLRLLQLRAAPSPALPRRRGFRGTALPPAALAGRSRLRGQARRRDRQRSHRDDPRPGDREGSRARDDAAALAHLRRLVPRRGPDRELPAPPPSRRTRLQDHALQEREHAALLLRTRTPEARPREEAPARSRAGAPGRREWSRSTSRPRTTPGTSASV